MASTYELLKAVHLLGVAVWVGGALVLQVLEIRTRRADSGRLESHLRDAEFVGTRVFIPASLVVLASGIALVVEGNWGLEPWILIGFAVWAASFLVGATFLGPESSRIFKLIDAGGLAGAEVHARARRLQLVSRIEDYLLVLVIANMVIKPGA